MNNVKIIISHDGQQRYIRYNSSVMGGNEIGPMAPEDAEHIVACIEACRWTPPKPVQRIVDLAPALACFAFAAMVFFGVVLPLIFSFFK